VATDQSNIEVSTGEVLTEYQILEGMLVHSANNFADLLAIWDTGSIVAFVQKMNAVAVSLGMAHTQYADASGYSSASVSSPLDQLKVARLDMENPVFAQIVTMPTVTLPVSGTVGSFTPLLGLDGVVGIKSGFTSAAGGCDVLALQQRVAGQEVEVLAVVVGDHVGDDVITGAGLEALSIARPVVGDVRAVALVPRGQRVATASTSGRSVPVVTRSSASTLGWPGQRITRSIDVVRRPRLGAPAGWRVGSVTIRLGPQKIKVPIGTSGRLPTLSFWQRVL
ncbi:MAG: hypothetical protein ACRDVW_12115, partial [Acidimicrobiales bacterium]